MFSCRCGHFSRDSSPEEPPIETLQAITMPLPVISTIQKLPPGPRSFLFFSGCNLVSWQCIVGPAMVLFARYLHMPPSWVGWLLAFLPLTNLLVVGMVPLVARMGPKRLMISTWGARNIAVGSVLLMPFVLERYGEHACWYLLAGAVLAFCTIRAVGSGGWLPWVFEIVPEDRRGPFFSAEAAIVQFLNIFVILGQGVLLRGAPGMKEFLFVYAFGICAGLISLLWMSRIPGGHSMTIAGAPGESYGAYRKVFRDGRYVRLVVFASIAYSAVTVYTGAQVMFLRDALGLGPDVIMVVLALGALGIVLSIHSWSNFTEHHGSGAAMRLALIGFGAAVLTLLFIAPGTPWAPYAAAACMVAAAAFSAAGFSAANRAMLNFTQAESRISYANFWSVGTSLALGFAPIAAGEVIERFEYLGFEICFFVAGILALSCAALASAVVPDARPETALPGHFSLHPSRPLRALANAAAITVGLHRTNRPD